MSYDTLGLFYKTEDSCRMLFKGWHIYMVKAVDCVDEVAL